MSVDLLINPETGPALTESGTPERDHGDTSAGKALTLLDAFVGARTVLGVTELATRAGLSKSTAHRLLTILVDGGYVGRVDDRYCLSERVFELGSHVRSQWPQGLRRRAMPHLAELYALSRETIHLAVLSGTDVLYLEKVYGREAARCGTEVGSRRPAYATALGKALLAFSDEATLERNLDVRFRRFTAQTVGSHGELLRSIQKVRETRIATDNEESRPGVNCIAVPILSPTTGHAVAAISICSASGRNLGRFSQTLLKMSEVALPLAESTVA